jgi:pimeloyl-ACP methyl ester carboxylesterase
VQRFSRSGLSFDVRDGGPREAAAVVLLHGFPQDATSWARVEPLLHDAGLRTLAPDQRGYSPGACPGGRAAYRIEELVEDVVALLDAAALPRAHLVGHDWGGGVAWEVAARHPDRIATLTVLSTPHPAALGWAYRHDRHQRRMSWYMAAFQLPWLPEQWLSRTMWRTLRDSGMPPLDAARDARRFAEPAALTGPIGWYRALPRIRRGTLAAAPARQRGTVPTTYLWGRHDIALGRAAAQRTGACVGADYRFVELDAGHWLPQTHPGDVARAVIEGVVRAAQGGQVS